MKVLFWVILLLGGSIATSQADMNDPVSLYLKVEDLPTERPITHILSAKGKLVIGSEDGLFVQGKDKSWKRALPFPHIVMELKQSGDMIVVLIEKSRRDMFSDRWWFGSQDGKTWKTFGKVTSRPLLAYDNKHHITYKANKGIYYKSSLHAFESGQSRLLGDKRLARIHALTVHPSTGYLLVGTYKELYLSKDQGRSFTPLNQKLGIASIKAGHIYHLFANAHYMIIQLDSYRIFMSADSGESWKELTKNIPLKIPKGSWHLHQIVAFDGSRMIVRKNSDYIIMDLANDTFSRIHLPRYYYYDAFAFHGNDLYAATKPVSNKIIEMMEKETSRKVKAPLLKFSLMPEPLCRLLSGNQKLVKLVAHVNSLPIVDNDSLYMLDKQFIWNKTAQKKLLNTQFQGWDFARGSKGHWYLKNGKVQNPSGTFDHHILIRSKDKGRTWQDTGTRTAQPTKAVYDDSLNVFYTNYRHTVIRTDWKNNQSTQHRFTDEEGIITRLLVDEDSRLWVTTKRGLFVSVPEGFRRIPLPFMRNKHLPITGFGLMPHHMIINYNGRIYISRVDKETWKSYRITDPCTDKKELDVRLVGSSDKLLVLQEQQYGHIWVFDPKTGEKERFYFPRENGIIRKVHIRANQQLLIETTGVPIMPNGDEIANKRKRPAPLLSYTIHLKS